MPQSVIESLLKQKIGLDANSIGSSTIARAIYQRMADCRISTMAGYLGLLQESPQEWEAFVESVVIPETWFFRERESFNFLKDYVLSEWLANNSNRILQILSVPCSTGEEPYSIAIALLEAGLTAANFRIDAIDISKKSLQVAQQAIYSQYSFRGTSSFFQEQYFQLTETGYQLCQQVRSSVNFMQGNLADAHFLGTTPSYDIVFCRNLLIYFDRATKERTIGVLERLLTQKGLLFVGHGEAGWLLNTKFIPISQPMVFAYRKSGTSHASLKSNHCKTAVKKHHPTYKTALKPPVTYNKQLITDGGKVQLLNESKEDMLQTARTLADRGCFQEATQQCNNYLKQNPSSAKAYVLLGQIQQATGQEEQAAQQFKKAIYLQPDCEEALIHLALLREHQGDETSAALLLQRIQRLRKKRK
ncbi:MULTISPECIES: CheR family methyltransferase [Nostocales]|uniref:Chemotaxis protein n=3 Tax=Nostocales TaxID=1161 RepID=A0A0C1NEE4_9CYAN|nr:protein-glutamate O-methyltransferase CheR [Tolypothrix bouteillei]KAF3887214.1 chemotaxis protein [Tolypothrix bouteillei VB521301]